MITTQDVKKIASLAHLTVSDVEVLKYQKQLSSIIAHIDQLKTLNVEGVNATTHVHGSQNVFRADQVLGSIPTEVALQNAPDRSGQFFRVPIIKDL